MKFRKRVEMACLLLAVVIAALSSSQRSPNGKPADATPLVLQHVLPTQPEQTFRVGDSREKARKLLGYRHFSQYISCGILNAEYWYLPDGSILSIDTGDEGETIRSLGIKQIGASRWSKIEVWNTSSLSQSSDETPWLTSVRMFAPMMEKQRGLAGALRLDYYRRSQENRDGSK